MAETLSKLRPDRDLQCYFVQPTAVAALSATSANGFTVSGSWRQQFDWTVVEWNRDNVFEHPSLRNLPDGDLSGLTLSYDEERTNCIPMDSTLYPTVDWPYLRVWSDVDGNETVFEVPLKRYASAVTSSMGQPTVTFELQGTVTPLDYIELAWLDQHFNYRMLGGDTVSTALTALAAAITANQETGLVTATANGNQITLTYIGTAGSNGNRIGVYGTVCGAGTESWAPAWGMFTGGRSPQTWHLNIDFGHLTDVSGAAVPTTNVRKLRWTWAADMQPNAYQRCEFCITVANWAVTGGGAGYEVAGAGSRRIEDDSIEVTYTGSWSHGIGNYSGGSIRWTTTPGNSLTCTYTGGAGHSLYLGSRRSDNAADVSIQVDGGTPLLAKLSLAGEDVLVRLPLGSPGAGAHSVTVTHSGKPGTYLYFDFIEVAFPSELLPEFPAEPITTLATDWDTLHSQAIAPERTAWLIDTLGFKGRANHYAGALWFYELRPSGFAAASGSITFSGTPQFGQTTQILLNATPLSHVNLIGDTAESIARCFALLINAGSNSVWASAEAGVLTITARAMGAAGNTIQISAASGNPNFSAIASGLTLAGGVDGKWITDTLAVPRMNRAARDWSGSFFRAMRDRGLEVAASFSTELGNGDDSVASGIAQRYPDGAPVWVNTPALQTNFGPQSQACWRQVYADMAALMSECGLAPYLQFGEVQWWYFASKAGMPFYDAASCDGFAAAFGRPLSVISSENADPNMYRDECAYLSRMIGEFTQAIMSYVRQTTPSAMFEVLYPPDVNATPLNSAVNFPSDYWTPAQIACLKTENFTYTGDRNLDKARDSIALAQRMGFPPEKASHLVGIGDYTTPWTKERQLAIAAGVESVVLFALDQFCLIGYALPLSRGSRRAVSLGR